MGPLVNQLNRLENVRRIDEYSPGRETTALAVKEDVIGLGTIPEASRHPGKESIGVDDDVEGRAETPLDQMENSADGRILEDMQVLAYTKLSKLVWLRGLY
ncbi:uncharacterized protein A4U43_C08F15800 [Asparagus officinalis]|nr:uncharacterized protein A4U43_C08F15800 [Asparagus officinalis]